MTKHKKHKKLMPEHDKNNVAFYKKKTEYTSRNDELKEDMVTILTPTNAEN